MSIIEVGGPLHSAKALAPFTPPTNITGLLDQLCHSVSCEVEGEERVSLGHVLDTVGRRAYGPLLLFIGLFSISPISVIPGMTWFSASLTLMVAGQVLIGRPNPWLPRRALAQTFQRRLLVNGVDKLRPVAHAIDMLLQPRLEFLTRPPFVNGVAALVVSAALITYPLGLFPVAPLLPGVAVVLFGLGMSARDGLVLLLGTALLCIAAWGLFSLPFWPF